MIKYCHFYDICCVYTRRQTIIVLNPSKTELFRNRPGSSQPPVQ